MNTPDEKVSQIAWLLARMTVLLTELEAMKQIGKKEKKTSVVSLEAIHVSLTLNKRQDSLYHREFKLLL